MQRGEKMKIATTIEEMYPYFPAPADAVRSYVGSGFKYLDYGFYNDFLEGSPFMLDDDSLWRNQVAETAQAAAECGFTFVQAHLPGYNPLGNADHPRCMRAMVRSAEACGMLGIPAMVVHTSFSGQHLYPRDQKEYFACNKDFLAPILAAAEKHGTMLCIENSTSGNMGNRYFPRTAGEMNDFITFVNHPLLGCCWDTGHAVMEGKSDQYADLMELGSNLKALHIHDNNGLSDQHLLPYCGNLKLDRIVEALHDMKFKGYFTFEANGFLNSFSSNPPLKKLPMEIRREALALLFKIGRFALDRFGIFEE